MIMSCNKLEKKLTKFLQKIPLYSPFKKGQSIFIKINDCVFEVLKEKNGFYIIQNKKFEDKLLLEFVDEDAFKYLFDSVDLKEYGNRLVALSTQGKIFMDLGRTKDPMKSGFYRFIGYLRNRRGYQTYIWIVPVK